MDPTNRINDLITITGHLVELLERENNALRNRQSQELHDILDEKVTLSRLYETRIIGLNEETEVLDEVEPELREKLKGLGEKIREMMEENAMLLKVAIEANKRVVNMIVEAVRETTHKAGTYAANGGPGSDGTHAAAQTVAISVDQTL
ncbi:MAG: flagellar export chaperone FlgN [Rhodospirillales bacterium]